MACPEPVLGWKEGDLFGVAAWGREADVRATGQNLPDLLPLLDVARELGEDHGNDTEAGIETLVVFLGANNALQSVTNLSVKWSDTGYDKLGRKNAYTVWRPEHFEAELDQLVAEGILKLLDRLQKEFNLAYMFITHDLATVRSIADEVVVMKEGRIVEQGPKNEMFKPPHHPYTDLLLSSVPEMDPDWLTTVLEERGVDNIGEQALKKT
mgnify:CR=1 FL=1